ncbi:hypothetical protein R9C00_00840 [Flammeovirgaceae bacterium SG7u.111]|nr:hypothetical protein [Flammeovirgaceae bacterium SG7u.132]WPO35995.1 hypothetical protein R9C00_00840 [Flammeovirgaceae bacterium SG7u.111]
MKKSLTIASIGLTILLLGCDGGINIKIQTVEKSTIEGLFENDVIPDGIPVGNVKIKIHAGNTDGTESGISISTETDSNGVVFEQIIVPPMKKEPEFEGYITWEKEGYLGKRRVY